MKMPRLIGLFLLLALAACSAPAPQKTARILPAKGQALLTVYLTTSDSSRAEISFTVEQIELFSAGSWHLLDSAPVRIERKDNRGQQLLLASALAPAGEHRRVRLQLSALTSDGSLIGGPENKQSVEIVLSDPLLLEERESRCLFVDWGVSPGQGGARSLLPNFTAYGQRNPLGANLVYIACADNDTVYVLRADSNEVVAAFAVPGPIGQIRVDPQTRRLYILSSGQRKLYVYDCAQSRFLEQIPLPGTISPEHLVLSPTDSLAYVTDAISGQVLKINLRGGVVTAQQRLSNKPESLIFFTSGDDRLAVLVPSAQKVYMLSGESLAVLGDFSVGMQPGSLQFFSGALYVSEGATNMVATYAHDSGSLRDRVAVGRAPGDLLAVGPQKLWVANRGSSSLSVLVAGQNTEIRRLKLPAAPSALELYARRNQVYALSEKGKSVTVIEVSGMQIRKTVRLAGKPVAISVLD